MAKNKRVKSGLLSAKDIMKGFTSMSNKYDIWTLAPIQCLPLEEKTKDWVKWNADWFENIALRELPEKAQKLERLYNLGAGVINKSDYIYNPDVNDVSNHLGIIGESDTNQTLLQQFFPLIPPVLKNFIGEFIKMDKQIIVDAVDPDSINEMIQFKETNLKNVLIQRALETKRLELMKMGLVPSENMTEEIAQYYQQEMDTAQKIAEIETKFKKFRTSAAQWGQNFIEKYQNYNYFDELELKLYIDSLVADETIIGLDLFEDDFRPFRLEPKKTYVNINPSKDYYSESNFVVNIEFMSIPEVINTFRNKLSDKQVRDLETNYNGIYTQNILMGTDSNGPFGSGYYNPAKNYEENQRVGANIKEAISDFNMEAFLHSAIGSKGSNYSYAGYFNNPKMIRVSRIWWASQKRIGMLYIAKDGKIIDVDTVDENYLVTEEPKFDKSLLNEESERTLVSGEYIKWTYVPEWRYVVKIGENVPYYIVNPSTEQTCIYLEGDPLPFQRKGSKNTYDARPPIEGRRISEKNTISVGFIEGLKPWQIVYNVVNNKILRLMPDDIGPVLIANESAINTNSLHNQDGRAPLFEFLDNLRDNKVLINKDLQTGMALNGKSVNPTILDISTIDRMKTYLELGSLIKLEAYESIGVSRERLSNIQASQSATGINQAVQGSINQTEVYFDIFSNKLMPRIWQMIIDYGQYYTSQKDSFSDTYINSNLDKVLFSIIKDDLLLKDLHVYAFSKANMRKLMNDLKMLMMQDNTMGASFLDKIKGLNSSTPSEIIEKLEKAEYERQEREKEIRDMDIQKQREQQEFLDKQSKEQAAKEDERFYAKLENDRYIGEVRAMGFSNNPDIDANQTPDILEVESLRAKGEQFATTAMLKERDLRMREKMHQDNIALKREDQNIKREQNASNERIAIENKNSADIQFQQKLKQDRNKSK